MTKNGTLESKISNLFDDLKSYIDTPHNHTEIEHARIKEEIDKIIFECLYYKERLRNARYLSLN